MTASAPDISSANIAFSNEVISPLTTSGMRMASRTARRTAHVDIDDFGTGGFGDPRAFRHPANLAARQLNHMRAYSGCFTAQPRHRATVGEVLAGGHLGNDESRAKRCGQASKRRIGDARHRR